MKKLLLILFPVLFGIQLNAQYTYHQFTYQSINRAYLLYIPTGYNGANPTPLVLALHGLGDTISNFKNIHVERVADTANFIFVMPQALVDHVLTNASAWNSGAGNFGVTLNPNVDDVGFLNALIDTISANYNIDQTRIYSTGFSMGGFMTNRLGCELNNRIAAIASVSGTIGNGITCSPSRVVPACHFHGTADQTVNYTGDLYGMDAEQVVAYWRAHDGCDTTPSSIDTLPQVVNDGKTFVHYTWPNGAYGSDVEFYKVINGVHEWVSDANINYSVAIWRFFSRYKWEPQTNGIPIVHDGAGVKVYPNPANNILTITATGFMPQLVNVYNINGQMVLQAKYTQQLNIGQLAQGSYIVEIKDATQTTRTRFVKM